MTIELIDQLTREHADRRNAVIAAASNLQVELDDAYRRYTPMVRRHIESLAASHGALDAAITAHAHLFPPEAKQRVMHGIKVGFQQSKLRVELADSDHAVAQLLGMLADDELSADDHQRLHAALKTSHKPVDAGLKKLRPPELKAIGAVVHPSVDCVLIKPVDEAAYALVQGLIRQVLAQTESE